MKLEINHLRKD